MYKLEKVSPPNLPPLVLREEEGRKDGMCSLNRRVVFCSHFSVSLPIVFVKHTEEAKAEITVYHPARLIHGLSAANCSLLNLLLAASPHAAFFSL